MVKNSTVNFNGYRDAHIQVSAQNRAVDLQSDQPKATRPATSPYQDAIDDLNLKNSTFTEAQLLESLKKHRLDPADSRSKIPGIVSLADGDDPETDLYASQDVLTEEGMILHDAQYLAHILSPDEVAPPSKFHLVSHDVVRGQPREVLRRHPKLSSEQQTAALHAMGAPGLSIISGEAGTGKTTLLSAIRQEYEQDGRRMLALSWTNAAAQELKDNAGFSRASTVLSELYRLERNRQEWKDRPVIVIDEAATIPTNRLKTLLSEARSADAKIILVGDEQQQSSIDRGGMFGTLVKWVGAADLSQVHRVSDQWQKDAFNHMHERRFSDALGLFSEHGAIHWPTTPASALQQLALKWGNDTKKRPEASRLALATFNADVSKLNYALRNQYRELGRLQGPDHYFDTVVDEDRNPTPVRIALAVGDRLEFRGNQKWNQIYNGRMGNVTKIDGSYVFVQEDGGSNVTLNVKEFRAFSHGYACTVARSQGKTVDETYLLYNRYWRDRNSYVALTRHRAKTELFVPTTAARDLKTLSRQMNVRDERFSASHFQRELDEDLVRGMASLSLDNSQGSAHSAVRNVKDSAMDVDLHCGPTDLLRTFEPRNRNRMTDVSR